MKYKTLIKNASGFNKIYTFCIPHYGQTYLPLKAYIINILWIKIICSKLLCFVSGTIKKSIIFMPLNFLKMSSEKEAKLKALQLTLDKLDKAYGKGTVMKMGDKAVEEVETIPSGSLGLDLALGVNGYPKGRVIEIYGPESSGKTTLTLHAIAEAQKAGGIAAFIDAEHAFDRNYAEKLGVDIENLIISQPDNGEQALEIAENLIRSGAIDIVVIDSVAALTPKSEIEGEMGDSKMGLHARLMSQALRKLTGTISKTNCTVFFINQLRENWYYVRKS
jgi:recombination protein RecA